MDNVNELRNKIKALGGAEHRLLKLHAYLYRHPELTDTRKLYNIYCRLVDFLKNIDARFKTIALDGFNGTFSFGDGAQAKRVFRENHYPERYSDKPRPWRIKDDRLYHFYIGSDGHVGSGTYSPYLMTARDLANHITGRGTPSFFTPVDGIQSEIKHLGDELKQRDYTVLDPIDLFPF